MASYLTYQQKIDLINTMPSFGPKGNKVWAVLKAMLVEACRAGRRFVTPKQAKLAGMSGCCIRTVQRVLGQLERAGIIRISSRFILVGEQVLQLANRIEKSFASIETRVEQAFARGLNKAKRDKFVCPMMSFIKKESLSTSLRDWGFGGKGLLHNLR